MNEKIELIQPILGMKPFLLVEFTDYDEETGDVGLSVQFGGGVVREEITEILDMVRESVEAQPQSA